MLKLMYEFKYYALFTMRQYEAAVRCLERIRGIDGVGVKDGGGSKGLQLRVSEEKKVL